MKKFNFFTKPAGKDGSILPPWGPWGCLWRTLLFLLSLGILILLLSFFRTCQGGGERDPFGGDPDVPAPAPIDVPADSVITIDDDAPIPGSDDPVPPRGIEDPGENLPPDDENIIPPVDDDEIVPDPITGRPMINDRINVILDSDSGDETFRRWADEFKANYPDDAYKVLFYDPLTKLIQIQVPAGTVDEMMADLPRKITDINFRVFREGALGPLARPNDPALRDPDASWYFEPIQVYDAWDITQGSEDIIVAIVDSYFDLRHPDLYSDRIVAPFSVKRRSSDVSPEPGMDTDSAPYFHGSGVASMAVANINNGNGAAGIAPKCKLMPISMGHQFTSMTEAYGILYAIYQGANVVNISAGAVFPEELEELPLEQQIELMRTIDLDEAEIWDYIFQLAEERGVTIVWSAGNDNILTGIDASKRNANTIRVSAVDTNLRKASFSNFGNFPEYEIANSTVSAPGVQIIGAYPGGGYTLGPGTSYSAPLVTGAVALMKSLDPTLTTPEIIQILQETGKPVEGSPELGPIIQIKDALMKVKEKMAVAEDIFSNHSMLLGKWKSTMKIKVYNAETHEWTGHYMYTYFDFKTDKNGVIVYNVVERTGSGTGQEVPECNIGPFTITWGSDSFVVEHSQSVGTFIPASYKFTKAGNGLLEYTNLKGGESYYIKRVDSMPCQ